MDRKGRSSKAPRHVRLYHWLMETDAWQSLDATARSIYIEIAARYNGKNNGSIPYSVRDARGLHVSKATASRALRRLEDRGFIVPVTKGKFAWKIRHATEWRLTEFYCDVTQQMASKTFASWSPKIQNTVSPRAPIVPLVKPVGPRSETVN